MEELKKCPFCGGEAETIGNYSARRKEKYRATIKCVECDASISRDSEAGINCAEKEAIEAWNRRTQ